MKRSTIILTGLVLFVIAVLWSAAVWGQGQHGQGHSENHDWYKTLISPVTGISCCDNRDCRPTRAYIDENGAWRAMLDGRWVEIPREKVLNTQAPDGNSHICANEFGMIFCFVGGVPKS